MGVTLAAPLVLTGIGMAIYALGFSADGPKLPDPSAAPSTPVVAWGEPMPAGVKVSRDEWTQFRPATGPKFELGDRYASLHPPPPRPHPGGPPRPGAVRTPRHLLGGDEEAARPRRRVATHGAPAQLAGLRPAGRAAMVPIAVREALQGGIGARKDVLAVRAGRGPPTARPGQVEDGAHRRLHC
jgi:hypothetical protein